MDRFGGARVVVVGDLCLDHYVVGEARRISREFPVPVLEDVEDDFRAGQAANAAANLAALGCEVRAVGMVGDDDAAKRLLEHLAAAGIDHSGVVAEGRTTVKQRVAARDGTAGDHHIARIDRLGRAPSPQAERRLADAAGDAARWADAVVVSDYGQGAATGRVFAATAPAPFRIADSRHRLLEFRGVHAAAPNADEARAAAAALGGHGRPLLTELGRALHRALGCEALLVTCGDDGLRLFTAHEEHHLAPLAGVRASDVSGAGDTVVAAFTVARCGGASYREAAELANAAAGLAVRRPGTAAVTARELAELAGSRG